MANIVRISLMDDTFKKALGWDDVIGIASKDVNIEIETSGALSSSKGNTIGITVWSEFPNPGQPNGTIPSPLNFDVQPFGAVTTGRNLFRLTKKISELGNFLGQGGVNDVATIVRDGGTSDAKFRGALGWPARGIATQPTSAKASTGDERLEIPDALALLKSGGVEVLKVGVIGGLGDPAVPPLRRLIRKPCKIVYYSGHGLSWNNCLGIEIGEHQYACWASPADLLPLWKMPACQNLDYFIIAGCSLLKYNPAPGTPPPDRVGLEWSKLLSTNGGCLQALLGYGASAPSDASAGDALASELGSRIAKGIGTPDLVEEWLTINGIRKAWNAVAIDNRGYWWIEPRRSWGMSQSFEKAKDIKGPIPIP